MSQGESPAESLEVGQPRLTRRCRASAVQLSRFATPSFQPRTRHLPFAESFHQWQKTRGEAHKEAEKLLLAVANEVGDRSIVATKALLIQDIEKVPDLLTQEQWQKYAA